MAGVATLLGIEWLPLCSDLDPKHDDYAQQLVPALCLDVSPLSAVEQERFQRWAAYANIQHSG